MTFINIRVVNDKRLEEKFDRLTRGMQGKIVRRALRVAFRPTLETARALAPVRTGALRASIKLRAIRRRRGSREIGVRVRTGTRSELGRPETEWHYYPAIVEYRSTPYLRSAFLRTRGIALRTFAGEIRKSVLLNVR